VLSGPPAAQRSLAFIISLGTLVIAYTTSRLDDGKKGPVVIPGVGATVIVALHTSSPTMELACAGVQI